MHVATCAFALVAAIGCRPVAPPSTRDASTRRDLDAAARPAAFADVPVPFDIGPDGAAVFEHLSPMTIGEARPPFVARRWHRDDYGIGPGDDHPPARPPRIEVGHVVVRGGLDPRVVRSIVLRNVSQVGFCYERARETEPHLRGLLTVDVLISQRGAGLAANVTQSPSSSREFGDCIAIRMRNWTYPASHDGQLVRATVPFAFAP